MLNSLEYGTATFDELPRIIEMKMTMFHEVNHAELLSPNAESIILEDYQRLYGEKNAQHFVARSNGRIVASVGAFIKSDLPFRYFLPASYGFIGDVYTEPSIRGKGVATKLNREALEWLGSRGVKLVRLLASDTARPLYERLGFTASNEMVLTFAI